jgi:hypothetical protein
MIRIASLLSLCGLLIALVLTAEATAKPKLPPPQGATSEAEAGPDFAIQGEYLGEFPADPKGACGIQVIALGEGQFQAVVFKGGLPGDGAEKKPLLRLTGRTAGGKTTFTGPTAALTIEDGTTLLFQKPGGTDVSTLKKVVRRSPTLGAKPPAGAVVLFDGTSADKFSDGRLTPDGLLKEGATSKQKFQNYFIHLEFMIPFMPAARGQGRGNSGYYAQGRYEVQILDSFGLDPQNNECGAIYGLATPPVIMSYPPLSWQTYDVDFTAAQYEQGKKVKNARLTVRHNGVELFKDVEASRATQSSPFAEGPDPSPFYLQDHGNPVRFRNVWVVEKK